jgi:hypothetical protein
VQPVRDPSSPHHHLSPLLLSTHDAYNNIHETRNSPPPSSPHSAHRLATYSFSRLSFPRDASGNIRDLQQTYFRKTGSLPITMNVCVYCLTRLFHCSSHIPATGREVDLMTRASLDAPLARDLLLPSDTMTQGIRGNNVAYHIVAMIFRRAQVSIHDQASMPFRPTVTTLEKD